MNIVLKNNSYLSTFNLINNFTNKQNIKLIRGNSISGEFNITLTTNINPLIEFGIRETLISTDLIYASTMNNKINLINTDAYNNIFIKSYKLELSAEDTNDLPITDLNNDGNYCNDKYLLGYLQVTYDNKKELLLELQVYVREGYYVFA